MYKIPKEKTIAKAILSVIKKHREIKSQRVFLDLVLKEIRRKDKEYAISEERVKRISTQVEEVKIFIETKKSNRIAKRCFVCGDELKEMSTKDLFGKKIPSGKRCKSCSFKIDKDNLAPRKYIFYMG